MINENNPLDQNSSQDETQFLPPDFSLKKIIGQDIDIKQIFSVENIAKAQNVINEQKGEFIQWVKQDIDLLDAEYKKAEADIENSTQYIKEIARLAAVTKSQAGTFGYALGTAVAKLLERFCNENPTMGKDRLTVIRKHIDTLKVIFAKNIEGDGGELGMELFDNLNKLVEKYR
ncbi:MAG: hypothetical protein WCL30_03290 [Pseudomonadota bacterium]